MKHYHIIHKEVVLDEEKNITCSPDCYHPLKSPDCRSPVYFYNNRHFYRGYVVPFLGAINSISKKDYLKRKNLQEGVVCLPDELKTYQQQLDFLWGRTTIWLNDPRYDKLKKEKTEILHNVKTEDILPQFSVGNKLGVEFDANSRMIGVLKDCTISFSPFRHHVTKPDWYFIKIFHKKGCYSSANITKKDLLAILPKTYTIVAFNE